MLEPKYTFTLPSIHDDTALDCRIYFDAAKLVHGSSFSSLTGENKPPRTIVKGALFAHPYAPLGGSYDDHVLLALCETLVDAGWVVGTFNFRGAGDSAGGTSWSGRAEQGDFVSVVGFLVWFLRGLEMGMGKDGGEEGKYLERIVSVENETAVDPNASSNGTGAQTYRGQRHIELILGGYSYGSLILARLPSLSTITQQFNNPEKGTSANEILLRAKTLATESRRVIEAARPSPPSSPRGRQLTVPEGMGSPVQQRTAASPIMLGGEETDPSERRRSRDSRRSGDLMRRSMEVVHIKRHSNQAMSEKDGRAWSSGQDDFAAAVSVRYLLISPVLLPFTQSLCPPGPPSIGFSLGKNTASNSGSVFLNNPTLAIFGSKDVFTSSQRLIGWAEKQAKSSKSRFEWENVEGAGHFWREEGAMQALQKRVAAWADSRSDASS